MSSWLPWGSAPPPKVIEDPEFDRRLDSFHLNESYVTLDHGVQTVHRRGEKFRLVPDGRPQVCLKIEVIDPVTLEEVQVTPLFEAKLRLKHREHQLVTLEAKLAEVETEKETRLRNLERQLAYQAAKLTQYEREKSGLQAQLQLVKEELEITKKEAQDLKREIGRVKAENKRLRRKLSGANSGDYVTPGGEYEQGERAAGEQDDIIYTCENCGHILFRKNQVISRISDSRNPSCLTSGVSNIQYGPRVCRRFPTGLYTVLQLFCDGCENHIGWKFEEAFEDRQRYREGKYMVHHSSVKEMTLSAGAGHGTVHQAGTTIIVR